MHRQCGDPYGTTSKAKRTLSDAAASHHEVLREVAPHVGNDIEGILPGSTPGEGCCPVDASEKCSPSGAKCKGRSTETSEK